MKKIISLILICTIFIGCAKKEETTTFYLDDEYYNLADYVSVSSDELNDMIKDKKSFALFVYQDLCVNSYNFETMLNEFSNENHINFVKIKFNEIEDTILASKIKYYPSLVIFKKGKIIDYLDANENSDTNKFKNKDDFTTWFKKYVKFKENTNFSKEEKKPKEENNNSEFNFTLDNITYDTDKVNIYFFYGDGCPHCKKEHEFFDGIKEKYGKYYNLHDFEVWYNEENANILEAFAFRMGDNVNGIPYTIIGSKTFIGFNDEIKNQMLNTIITEHKNSYDVYLKES